jgi:hypothetical protein
MKNIIIVAAICLFTLVHCQPTPFPNKPKDDPPSRQYVEANFYLPEDQLRRVDPEISASSEQVSYHGAKL